MSLGSIICKANCLKRYNLLKAVSFYKLSTRTSVFWCAMIRTNSRINYLLNNIHVKMTERKPKIIVFDLDYTLWPFWVDTNVTPPFRKSSNNVVDADGKLITYYPDSFEVLKRLVEQGYEIGVASRTSEIRGANQLINLFGWDKYIKYKEIYPGIKTAHFSRIKKSSGVNYKDMIFFDDEERNINDLTKVGVLSILVKDGITHKVVEEGLKQFSNTQ